MYDTTAGIIAYEDGELDENQVVELFQHLIDKAIVWQLQGHYGRTAVRLIEAGFCFPNHKHGCPVCRGGKPCTHRKQKLATPRGVAYAGTHDIGGSD
jgi:hypothetical protein